MQKEDVLRKIKGAGLVAVVRAGSSEKAVEVAEACIEGGVAAIEFTFTVPFAHRVIEDMARRYQNGEIIIGAGTVLDPETARIALLSGAEFVVSPCLNVDVIKMCNRYRAPVMPGVMTVTEVVEAMEAGADILKIFPGDILGPQFIKAIKGPLPKAQLMPTGGVDLENVGAWIKAGAVAVGAGSAMTKGGRNEIVTRARGYIEEIQKARGEL